MSDTHGCQCVHRPLYSFASLKVDCVEERIQRLDRHICFLKVKFQSKFWSSLPLFCRIRQYLSLKLR